MRLNVLLSSAAIVAATALPAAACGWNKTQMTMAEHKVPATQVQIPAKPYEVALRDVWLERLVG